MIRKIFKQFIYIHIYTYTYIKTVEKIGFRVLNGSCVFQAVDVSIFHGWPPPQKKETNFFSRIVLLFPHCHQSIPINEHFFSQLLLVVSPWTVHHHLDQWLFSYITIVVTFSLFYITVSHERSLQQCSLSVLRSP